MVIGFYSTLGLLAAAGAASWTWYGPEAMPSLLLLLALEAVAHVHCQAYAVKLGLALAHTGGLLAAPCQALFTTAMVAALRAEEAAENLWRMAVVQAAGKSLEVLILALGVWKVNARLLLLRLEPLQGKWLPAGTVHYGRSQAVSVVVGGLADNVEKLLELRFFSAAEMGLWAVARIFTRNLFLLFPAPVQNAYLNSFAAGVAQHRAHGAAAEVLPQLRVLQLGLAKFVLYYYQMGGLYLWFLLKHPAAQQALGPGLAQYGILPTLLGLIALEYAGCLLLFTEGSLLLVLPEGEPRRLLRLTAARQIYRLLLAAVFYPGGLRTFFVAGLAHRCTWTAVTAVLLRKELPLFGLRGFAWAVWHPLPQLAWAASLAALLHVSPKQPLWRYFCTGAGIGTLQLLFCAALWRKEALRVVAALKAPPVAAKGDCVPATEPGPQH